MALGPGKYDADCTVAKESTGGGAVVLLVLGGKHGSGFSVQTESPLLLANLPSLLRFIANDIEFSIPQS